MGCNNFQTEKTDQLVEANLRGDNAGIESFPREIREMLEKVEPAAEAAKEARTIELLQENVRNSQEKLNEARTLSAEGSREGKEEWERKLEELDHGKWPSDKEFHDTVRAGRELEIREWSCASLPPITGFGVKDMQPHIKETIAVLSQNEKLWQYRQLWSEPFANKILFADRTALKEEGINVPKNTMAFTMGAQALHKDLDLPQTIVVFGDSNGKFPKGNELLGYLVHEIAHCNEHFGKGELRVEGQNMGWFKPVAISRETDPKIWERAVEAQLRKGFASESSQMTLSKEEKESLKSDPPLAAELMADREIGNRHFVHEHFAAWIMNSPKLCDEMRRFFDEYMPKAFGE